MPTVRPRARPIAQRPSAWTAACRPAMCFVNQTVSSRNILFLHQTVVGNRTWDGIGMCLIFHTCSIFPAYCLSSCPTACSSSSTPTLNVACVKACSVSVTNRVVYDRMFLDNFTPSQVLSLSTLLFSSRPAPLPHPNSKSNLQQRMHLCCDKMSKNCGR